MTREEPAAEHHPTKPFVFDLRELAGAVADLGPLISIAAVLVVQNGINVTAILVPVGCLYVVAGLVYRVPVPVQPMKAFGGLAIASGLGAEAIAAGALLLGVVFVLLGLAGVVDALAPKLPHGIVRGVQLYVGFVLLNVAVHLVLEPSPAFLDAGTAPVGRVVLAGVVLAALLALRRYAIAVVVVAVAVVVAALRTEAGLGLGPVAPVLVQPAVDDFRWALATIVVSQTVLTLAGTCVATSDAARAYFGERGSRVRPGRLALTTGGGNLLVGAVGGMPLCHGSGGLTAHRMFGARTGAAPVLIGGGLIAVCLLFGQALSPALAGIPLPVVAALIAATGLLHIGLLRDQRGVGLVTAVVVGVVAFAIHIVPALALGLLVHWAGKRLPRIVRSVRR